MRVHPDDLMVAHLKRLSAEFRQHETAATVVRRQMDRQIQAMKAAGYSYPVLAEITGLAIATIQYAVAREENLAHLAADVVDRP
jgi:hypothetical protein